MAQICNDYRKLLLSGFPDYDTRFSIWPHGYGSSSGLHAWNRSLKDSENTLKPVMQAYAEANPGKGPGHPDELLPYLTTEEGRAAFDRLRASRNKPNG